MRITNDTLATLGSVTIALALAGCDRGPDGTIDRNAFSDDEEQVSQEEPAPDVEEEDEDEDGDESQGSSGGCEDDGVGESEGDDPHDAIPPGCEYSAFDLDRLADYVESTSVITDCDGWWQTQYPGTSWRAADPSDAQLWVAGVYQTRNDHSFDHHPMGAGYVTWTQPGDNVLVVSAYEPTTWTIEVAEGASLARVIAVGYEEQIIVAPEGVATEVHMIANGLCDYQCGFQLPGVGDGCEGEDLVGFAEHVSGRSMTAFDGCYDATTFAF